MLRRLRLTIAYDGGPFAGWQSQAHRNTVQDVLERAFEQVNGATVRLHGAGRTDAGVHARGQSAHADVDDRDWKADRWRSAINGLLPPTIRLMQVRYVTDDFHARFTAVGKVYRYSIYHAEVLPPSEHGRVWHIARALNLPLLAAAAEIFAGTHDFARFSANGGSRVTDSIRTIQKVTVTRRGSRVILEFAGDGFLYKMVRLMVGAAVQCALGRTTKQELVARLRNERSTTNSLVAPAAGLVLIRVRY